MCTVRDLSSAAQELEFHGQFIGEWTDLKRGDRVSLQTDEGDYPGTVYRDWSPVGGWPAAPLAVRLDCKPEFKIEFHRTMFRAHTVLDFLAAT